MNNITDEDFPGVTGSISTIAGNFLASKMLGQLQQAIEYQGDVYKLNLLFSDFQPLMSLFALIGMPNLNTNFYGLPDFGSIAVFELFSFSEGTDVPAFPREDDLYVQFFFKNGTDGTDASADYQAYPMFNQGREETGMKWTEFQSRMFDILAGDVGDWCTQCGAPNLFCAYWNGSASLTSLESGSSSHHGGLSPVLSGVVGAIVALGLAAVIFAGVMVIAGLRFHRVHSKKSELKGFKGSQKMASDKDLIIPKGGAVVGATVETPGSPRGGHERVGSWELKNNEAGMPNIAAPVAARRPSYEDDEDIAAAPYRVPTKPDERV